AVRSGMIDGRARHECLAPQRTSVPGCARLRGCGAQLRAARTDRPEPLVEARPGPRLDLPVPGLGLVAGRLEVLEPGVRLLDHEQLLRLALVHHPRRSSPGSLTGMMLGPGPDDIHAESSRIVSESVTNAS